MPLTEYIFDPTNGPILKLMSPDGNTLFELSIDDNGKLFLDGAGIDALTLDGNLAAAFAAALHASEHHAGEADALTANLLSSAAAAAGLIMETDGAGGWTLISTPGGAGISDNFLFAYDTTTQTLSAGNTFEPVTFDTNAELDGWTHVAGTNVFGCTQTAKYEATLRVGVESLHSGIGAAGIRAVFDGVEVAGSYASKDITNNNVVQQITSNFIVDATTAQDLTIEFAGNDTGIQVAKGPDPAGAGTVVSAALTLRRIN